MQNFLGNRWMQYRDRLSVKRLNTPIETIDFDNEDCQAILCPIRQKEGAMGY